MKFINSLWANFVTFIVAVADAFANFMQGRWKPHHAGPPAFVIRRNGIVENDYYKDEEKYPSINITGQLELLMKDIKKIPKPLERFGVDEKTKKLKSKVFIEPCESTVASLVCMKKLTASNDYKEFTNDLLQGHWDENIKKRRKHRKNP